MKVLPNPASPWRQPMVWLVISGPAAVVIASIFTVTLAIRHPDPPLELRQASAQAADDSADLRARAGDVPALVARNHAATGTTGSNK